MNKLETKKIDLKGREGRGHREEPKTFHPQINTHFVRVRASHSEPC